MKDNLGNRLQKEYTIEQAKVHVSMANEKKLYLQFIGELFAIFNEIWNKSCAPV